MASKKDTDDYKNELQCKIKACKEKITENDRVLLIINDQISMYKRVLDKLEPFDLKDFNKQNDRFLKDNDYLNMSSLPSIEDVINNIINYRNISNDMLWWETYFPEQNQFTDTNTKLWLLWTYNKLKKKR